MKPYTKQQLIQLVIMVEEVRGSEEDIDAIVGILQRNLVDPQLYNYLFHSELSASEIVEKALSYKPFCL